jgi:hypothetical protein
MCRSPETASRESAGAVLRQSREIRAAGRWMIWMIRRIPALIWVGAVLGAMAPSNPLQVIALPR